MNLVEWIHLNKTLTVLRITAQRLLGRRRQLLCHLQPTERIDRAKQVSHVLSLRITEPLLCKVTATQGSGVSTQLEFVLAGTGPVSRNRFLSKPRF